MLRVTVTFRQCWSSRGHLTGYYPAASLFVYFREHITGSWSGLTMWQKEFQLFLGNVPIRPFMTMVNIIHLHISFREVVNFIHYDHYRSLKFFLNTRSLLLRIWYIGLEFSLTIFSLSISLVYLEIQSNKSGCIFLSSGTQFGLALRDF